MRLPLSAKISQAIIYAPKNYHNSLTKYSDYISAVIKSEKIIVTETEAETGYIVEEYPEVRVEIKP